MGYTGEYHDAETGFIYLRARYYSPELGRFINEDPLRDGLNWYIYCGNDPVNRTDPNGEFWGFIWDAVSFVGSVVDVIANPTDAGAWLGLIGDAVDLLPFVSGVGETVDVIRFTSTSSDAIQAVIGAARVTDTAKDSIKAAKNIQEVTSDASKYTKHNYRKAFQEFTGELGEGKEAHHVFPQKFETEFSKSGMKIHEPKNITWVDPSDHHGWSMNTTKSGNNFLMRTKIPPRAIFWQRAKNSLRNMVLKRIGKKRRKHGKRTYSN